jgi:hypothetical protein
VVADWWSDDWPLHEWLRRATFRRGYGVPCRVIQLDGFFSRGRGLNACAATAFGDALLFLDADCTINASVLRTGLRHVRRGRAWFPIFYQMKRPPPVHGRWFRASYGVCMVDRQAHEEAGGIPEYATWGMEDRRFCNRVKRIREVVREKVPGLVHQWHPPQLAWKNQHARPGAAEGDPWRAGFCLDAAGG